MPWRSASTIGRRVVPTLSGAGGVWRLGEVEEAKRDIAWPGARDPLFSSVTLLLPFDGAAGDTTTADLSGNSNTITMYNGAALAATSPHGGTSLAVDGIDDFVGVAASASGQFGTGDFTVEAWVNLTSLAAETVIGQVPTTNPSWYLFIDSSGVRFGRHGSPQYHSTTNTLTTGTWHHVAAVRDSGVVRIYFDGTLQSVTAVGGGIGSYDFSAANAMEIGRMGTTSNRLSGNIDDLRITKAARYNADFTPPGPLPTS